MKKDFWEINAKSWDQVIESQAFKSRPVTSAALLNEIQKHQLKSVLDIGCGEGWIAGALDLKEIEYLGIDGSSALIEIAKSKHEAHFAHVTYQQLAKREWRSEQRFDAAIFNFSLLDQNIESLLVAAAEQLKSTGLLMIQTLHPCFVLNPYQDGVKVEDFKTSPVPFSGEMPWFGRTLESWVKLFKQCGLRIDDIIEPSVEDKPVSILFELRRLSSQPN